jgi:hypothetical protein
MQKHAHQTLGEHAASAHASRTVSIRRIATPPDVLLGRPGRPALTPHSTMKMGTIALTSLQHILFAQQTRVPLTTRPCRDCEWQMLQFCWRTFSQLLDVAQHCSMMIWIWHRQYLLLWTLCVAMPHLKLLGSFSQECAETMICFCQYCTASMHYLRDRASLGTGCWHMSGSIHTCCESFGASGGGRCFSSCFDFVWLQCCHFSHVEALAHCCCVACSNRPPLV